MQCNQCERGNVCDIFNVVSGYRNSSHFLSIYRFNDDEEATNDSRTPHDGDSVCIDSRGAMDVE